MFGQQTRVTLLAAAVAIAVSAISDDVRGQSLGRDAPDPLVPDHITGSEGKGYWTGAGVPPEYPPVYAARDGAVPAGVEPLPTDIFSTSDFYQDEALWFDPHYYRCNSPVGLEQIWGAYEAPLIGADPPRTAAWGYCDRDYPREEIVSPYGFTSAKAHYEALLNEAGERGDATANTQASQSGWSGRYVRQNDKRSSWFNGAILQVPTYLSLLTPEYQRRFVQQMYHYSGNSAPQWPGSYCWPEGFLRRFAQYGGGTVNLVVSEDLVFDMRIAAKTLITQIHIGQTFDESGEVPRLGPGVPQWFGDTIGFWDSDALITWTSNLQGWINHGGMEYSNHMQSIEIYTPRYGDNGDLLGLKHEVVLYDDEALVDPVRIVHLLDRQADLTQVEPLEIIECVASIFPVDGLAQPLAPGTTFDYTLPDIYARPWARIWEEHHEEGMQRPEREDIFTFN